MILEVCTFDDFKNTLHLPDSISKKIIEIRNAHPGASFGAFQQKLSSDEFNIVNEKLENISDNKIKILSKKYQLN